LRALLGEVKHVLTVDDARWAELGLSAPASYRASKDTRERKAQLKAQARTEQIAINGRKRAEDAKVASEKARSSGRSLSGSDGQTQGDGEKLALKADSLFERADQLDAK